MASQAQGPAGPEAGTSAADAAAQNPGSSSSSRRRRRARQDEPRPHTATVRLSDQEQALLESTSRSAGLSIGAYLATVTLAHARDTLIAVPAAEAAGSSSAGVRRRGAEVLREFAQARDAATAAWRQLRTVGGLLNQVATVGNSTGELPPNTASVLDQVARATARVDTTVGELRALTRAQAGLTR